MGGSALSTESLQRRYGSLRQEQLDCNKLETWFRRQLVESCFSYECLAGIVKQCH